MAVIVMPTGALGASDSDTTLDTLIRSLALALSSNPEPDVYPYEWPEKYGTEIDTEDVMMHPFCWCELEECAWCCGDWPNLLLKRTGLEVRWYKYIGRGMATNRDVTDADVKEFWRLITAARELAPNTTADAPGEG